MIKNILIVVFIIIGVLVIYNFKDHNQKRAIEACVAGSKTLEKPMMKMLLTGEPINANYAKEIGLINDYFLKTKLNKEVIKVANKIASKSNLTIKIGKQAFYKQLEMPLNKAYAYTSKMMTLNMMAMDAKEGISAFLEKRKPNWKNK